MWGAYKNELKSMTIIFTLCRFTFVTDQQPAKLTFSCKAWILGMPQKLLLNEIESNPYYFYISE
jgi:hypothetical protein